MTEVLLVEDSPTQREMIASLMQKNGLAVRSAIDGVEALEAVRGQVPDIIVLDVVMPRMNGYEVCRRLKSDPATESTPIVMCSSKDEDFDRYWGMRQGADAYVAKPFLPQEFIKTIQTLTSR
ncbi:MAG: response regulator [Cyanobacteria bacterium P01_D01_bin.123]